MRQNYSKTRHYLSRTNGHIEYYNVPLLRWYREQMNLTVHAVGVAIGMNPDTCAKVFKGLASHKQLWRIAEFVAARLSLRMNDVWVLLHDTSLRTTEEFDRAVFSRKAVRSSGPARVGAHRPAPKNGGTYTRVRG